ncbi:MAG TPA: hypothetical protein VMX97_08020, partial [Hyphomicrobiaceae bacterium]|nr:hypothetical protein [Hyphomicrobiaceae bacterium]
AYRVYGRRVALGSAIIFTLMYFPMRYGMETRSYAQILFLSCLSSWLFFLFVTKLPRPCHWRELILNRGLLWLTLANTALLMTHYYSVFFLGAQALFILILFLTRHPRLGIAIETAKVAVIYATPVVLLLLAWGWAMAHRYAQFESRGNYHRDFPSMDPWTIFSYYVIGPTFSGGELGTLAPSGIAIALILLSSRAVWTIYRSRGRGAEDRAYFTLYFLTWTFVPCIMAFLLFLVAGVEKYNERYFIFCAPPLAVLILLAFESLVRFASSLFHRFTVIQPARNYARYALLYAIVVALLVAAPGGRQAASTVKDDYRGVAQMMANLVRGDPEHSYILYEASRRKNLDFYLEPMTRGQLRIADTITPRDEERARLKFEKNADKIEGHDFLVVGFPHRRFRNYPRSTARLEDLYNVQFKMLGAGGHGIVVYKTKK